MPRLAGVFGRGRRSVLWRTVGPRGELRLKRLEAMGGRVEAVYWAFGDDDVYAIADLPDNVSAAAISLSPPTPVSCG